MDTVELKIDLKPKQPWSEILIARLSDNGFDSFVETNEGILAYANGEINVDEVIKKIRLNEAVDVEYSVSDKVIPHQNWNAKWESDFHPVFVDDFATILAPFHKDVEVKGIPIIIQPQMSFGTGHHQTTWLMTKAMCKLKNMPSNVLDMGTGTGVLAIVAEKLGAKNILAIDIEDWSVENAKENAERNGCTNIRCVHGDVDKVNNEKFGLIIANINKNILTSHLEEYARALEPNGVLLLSGFFTTDVNDLVELASNFGLSKELSLEKEGWAGIQLRRTN